MTTIAAQIREAAERALHEYGPNCLVCRSAGELADIISEFDRLRVDLDVAQRAVADLAGATAEITSLRADNERMREALEAARGEFLPTAVHYLVRAALEGRSEP